jgi:hypothetical protein
MKYFARNSCQIVLHPAPCLSILTFPLRARRFAHRRAARVPRRDRSGRAVGTQWDLAGNHREASGNLAGNPASNRIKDCHFNMMQQYNKFSYSLFSLRCFYCGRYRRMPARERFEQSALMLLTVIPPWLAVEWIKLICLPHLNKKWQLFSRIPVKGSCSYFLRLLNC